MPISGRASSFWILWLSSGTGRSTFFAQLRSPTPQLPMPQLKAPTRFLLRGSALLIGLLTLWWFVFLDPMLSALQGVGDIAARLVFGVPRTDVIGFTFSLPVFWAVVLAAPGWRRNLRPFLAGTGLIVLVELI